MTEEQRAAYLAALIQERAGYEARKRHHKAVMEDDTRNDAERAHSKTTLESVEDSLKAVDAEVARIRGEAQHPAQRAQTRDEVPATKRGWFGRGR